MPSEHFSDGMIEKKTRLSAFSPEILRQCGLGIGCLNRFGQFGVTACQKVLGIKIVASRPKPYGNGQTQYVKRRVCGGRVAVNQLGKYCQHEHRARQPQPQTPHSLETRPQRAEQKTRPRPALFDGFIRQGGMCVDFILFHLIP